MRTFLHPAAECVRYALKRAACGYVGTIPVQPGLTVYTTTIEPINAGELRISVVIPFRILTSQRVEIVQHVVETGVSVETWRVGHYSTTLVLKTTDPVLRRHAA